MATFYNSATLSYNGNVTTSNVVQGELVEALSVSKTPVNRTYLSGDNVTYVITLTNSGTTALTGLTVTDNLGAYTYETQTLVPLTYMSSSLLYYVNGILQPTPTVDAGPPLTITGITLPAGGNISLIYEATVNQYANPSATGSIANQVTVTGTDLAAPMTATATVTAADPANLSVSKSMSPSAVSENSRLTYTFLIQNSGNSEAGTSDNVVLTDTFNPTLSNLTVTFNGTTWTSPTNYTYDSLSGVFSTVAGQITVSAATYTQTTAGNWETVPGTSTLIITGTV